MSDNPAHTAALPFVAMREQPKVGEFPRCFWTAKPSGDWDADNRFGHTFARQALEAMRDDRFPGLLAWIVADMMKRKKFDAVMVGFLHGIGEALVPQPSMH